MVLPKLASAGAVVKIWNESTVVQLFAPFDKSERVSSISWSPSGQHITSCSDKGNKVVVTDVDCPTRTICMTPKDFHTFGSYSSTKNSIVLTCGKGSNISIWNLQSQSTFKTLKTSVNGDNINCAAFDARDSYVACGMNNGAVQIINNMTTASHAPIICPNVQAITGLKHSPNLKNWLGSSSDDGSCNLWDCSVNKRIHSFKSCHSAPATGVCFSPINDVLMATVGFDKIVQFYDARLRKLLFKLKTDDPLNCLDFSNDGQSIAVGSTRGSIFIYDLRTTDKPLVSMLNCHEGAVSAVLFKNVSKVEDDFIIDAGMRQKSCLKLDNEGTTRGLCRNARHLLKTCLCKHREAKLNSCLNRVSHIA